MALNWPSGDKTKEVSFSFIYVQFNFTHLRHYKDKGPFKENKQEVV